MRLKSWITYWKAIWNVSENSEASYPHLENKVHYQDQDLNLNGSAERRKSSQKVKMSHCNWDFRQF